MFIHDRCIAHLPCLMEGGGSFYKQIWGGMSFPGFMILLGSRTDFIFFIVLNASSPSSSSRYWKNPPERILLL